MCILKYDTNELIYKEKQQTHRQQIYGYQKGKGVGGDGIIYPGLALSPSVRAGLV